MKNKQIQQTQLTFDCEQLEERQMLSTVSIFAAGATNDESIELKIDDAVVQTFDNVGGDADGNQFVELQFTSDETFDAGQVKIEFINDLFDPLNNVDRNVRIDRIVIDGRTFQTESPSVFSTGTWKPEDGVAPGNRESEYLHSNGFFQYSSTDIESTTIRARVRGDEGTEQFNLLIDGVAVGSYNASTDWSLITYVHESNASPDDVRIEMVNSVWLPAQGIDTNLLVDYVEINGQVYETEADSVFSTGTWTSEDGIAPGFGRGDTLHSDGYFQYSNGNEGSRILVRARGDEGTERFNLVIDGEIIRTYDVTSTSNFQVFAHTHDAVVSPEDIRIEFIDDLWIEGVIDENLVVDYISVDDKVYQSENPSVFSTGTWKPEDGIVPGFRESETLHAGGYLQFANSNYLAYRDAEGDGQWSDVEPLGIIPIHAMVLPDGKVFSFGTTELGMQGAQFVYSLYDPETGVEVVLPNTTDTDIFCSNMSLDPVTGNVLIFGGDARGEGGPVNGAVDDVLAFDYASLTIRNATQGEMAYDRWYGSSITLPNGEILVLGGRGGGANVPEVFNATTGWRTLTDVEVNVNYYYPKMHVTSDGSVVAFSARGGIYRISTEGTGSSERIGTVGVPHQPASPGIMYDIDQVAIIGSDAKIYTADLSAETVTFTAAADVIAYRRDAGMSMLPDGRVIITGGGTQFNVLSSAIYPTEIWDPTTDEVEVVESIELARLYHSTHLLLPDGTIWAAGGGAPGPLKNLNGEFYAPDYLYRSDGTLADRPVITESPLNVDNDEDFLVSVSDSSRINRVTAVRSGALTHAVNNDNRFVELDFQIIDSDTLSITTLDANVMVPGTWMLFVIDENGVPSEAGMLGVAMADVVETPHLRS
ncbi:MAG: carbohydrate-binding domain-containing protein [Pirellulaceae bacterium]